MNATTVAPTLRPGSTGYLASQQLQAQGPMSTFALAAAIDKPEDELVSLLAYPVRLDQLRYDKATDRWSLGDGSRRQPDPPPAPPPPAPPPINRFKAPPAVLDLPKAAPPPAPAPVSNKPKPAVKQTRAQQVQRAMHVGAQREQGAGVDIDAVHSKPAQDQVPVFLEQKPAAVLVVVEPPPAAPAPQPPAPEPVPAPAEHKPLSPAEVEAARYMRGVQPVDAVGAWCSDGTYVIEKHGTRIELNLDEALRIHEHLVTMWRGIEVVGVPG